MLHAQLYKPQQLSRAVLARDVPAGGMSGLPSALSHSRRSRRRPSAQSQRTGGPRAQRASCRGGDRVGSSLVHTLRKHLPQVGFILFSILLNSVLPEVTRSMLSLGCGTLSCAVWIYTVFSGVGSYFTNGFNPSLSDWWKRQK